MTRLSRFVLVQAVTLGLICPAAAENSSIYTDVNLGKCREEAPDPDDPLQSGLWWCEGYEGITVRVAEGDLRFLVSYGERAAEELAASQTVPAFNHLGERIEWRLDPSGKPFATVLRFHTDSDGLKGSTLVITRIGTPGQVCHVGYVNAVANTDANDLARKIADEVAPRFRCGEETAHEYGLTGDEVPERY